MAKRSMKMKAKTTKKAMKMKAKKSAKKSRKMKKVKKVSKIQRGKQGKSQVFKGRKEKTLGGLRKADLVKNKYGKVVSRKMSARARKNSSWTNAVKRQRSSLKIKGFCPVARRIIRMNIIYE